eukprot:scaffold20.g7840.t1
MGCGISRALPAVSASDPAQEEPYPENGKKLRTDTMLLDVYIVGKTIGEGGFSKVKLVTEKATGQQYACKVMPLPKPGHKLNEYFTTRSTILAEIDILLDLDHPNVVCMKDFAKKHPRGTDVLPQTMKTVCGTEAYMAPEILKGSRSVRAGGFEPYGPACDLWACGVILYMLLSGQLPFSAESQPRLFRTILAGKHNFAAPVFATVSAEAKDLISKLLVVDSGQRLTSARALAHPWFRAARVKRNDLREAVGLLATVMRADPQLAPLQQRIAAALAAAGGGGGDGLLERTSTDSVSRLLERLSMSACTGPLSDADLEAAKAALAELEGQDSWVSDAEVDAAQAAAA